MAATPTSAAAISSFWIRESRLIGPFFPIHLLSVFVIYTRVTARLSAYRGTIAAHQRSMVELDRLG